jgi:isoquinoline 1-oxidoreductase subunit alpha
VQRAWVELDTPQCGYCQPGMIMAAAALLSETPQPTDKDIDQRITNICRCGTFARVRQGIHRAAELATEVKA